MPYWGEERAPSSLDGGAAEGGPDASGGSGRRPGCRVAALRPSRRQIPPQLWALCFFTWEMGAMMMPASPGYGEGFTRPAARCLIHSKGWVRDIIYVRVSTG